MTDGGIRAAIYCRVSTQEQRAGYSLQGQYADCRSYCDREGYKVVRSVRDVASGRTTERAGFRHIIEAATRRRFDVIVVWRRDRFGRDAVMNGILDRLLTSHEIRIEAIQTGRREASSYTEFVDRIMDAVDELEAKKINERCQLGRETAARSGIWPCRPPTGYRRLCKKGPLEADPDRAPEIVALYERVAAGTSLRSLARVFGRDHTTLLLRVRNTAYLGRALYAGIEVPIPPLVSAELWATANARLDQAARSLGRAPTKRRANVKNPTIVQDP